MGLRAALAEQQSTENAPVRMHLGYEEQVYLDDQLLVSEAGSYLLRDELDDPFIRLDNLWRLKPAIASRDWGDLKPAWLDQAVSEGEWAHSNAYENNGVCWICGDDLILQTRFTLTLSERVTQLDASSVRYSETLRGWVLVKPNLDDGSVQELLIDYDVLSSPMLSARLEGRERWKEILDRHVADAVTDEYRLPDTYLTDRRLKPHQEESVLAAAEIRQVLLADQVGLGKGGTFTNGFLAILQRWIADGNTDSYGPLVVVVNKSMKDEITEEISKWKQDAYIAILDGQRSQQIPPDAEFIVLNVDLLHHRLNDIIAVSPGGMVVDEAHTLKNTGARRTQAAQALADHLRQNCREEDEFPYILLASGTPFLNHPSELYSLLSILGVKDIFVNYARTRLQVATVRVRTRNGVRNVPLGDRYAFEMRWCGGHMNRYNQWELGGATNSAELNRLLLQHVMIRRRKRDVMDPLPELEENVVPIQLSDDYRDEYLRLETEFLEVMRERAVEEAAELGITVAEALKIVTQKVKSAGAVMQMTAMRQTLALGKIELAKRWIHRFMDGDPEITGGDPTRKKLILFVYHRAVQEVIINDVELRDRYGMVCILSGADMPGSTIQENKRKFQEDDRCRLIVCYSGAREGHTLTAAKDVALLELPFVPAWIVQMAGRAWARISELYPPHEAYLHYLVTPDTVDSVLLRKNRLKKSWFDAVIDDEGQEENPEGDDLDTAGDIIVNLWATQDQRRLRLAV